MTTPATRETVLRCMGSLLSRPRSRAALRARLEGVRAWLAVLACGAGEATSGPPTEVPTDPTMDCLVFTIEGALVDLVEVPAVEVFELARRARVRVETFLEVWRETIGSEIDADPEPDPEPESIRLTEEQDRLIRAIAAISLVDQDQDHASGATR